MSQKNVTETNGSGACPFYYLYWHFIKKWAAFCGEYQNENAPQDAR